jgi:hypothetical protein
MVLEEVSVALGVVASVITIIGALVGLANFPAKQSQRKIAFAAILVIGFVLLAVAAVAVVDYYNPPAAATITHPAYGDSVGTAATISGTWTNTKNDTVWIVVYDYNASRYYPEGPSVALSGGGSLFSPPTGTWIYHAYFNSTEIGKNFEMRVIAANDSATAALKDYTRVSSEKGSWPGLPSLPDGANTMDYVIVKRAD